MASVGSLKEIASSTIDSFGDELDGVSRKIWERPELRHEETYAHDLLTDFLESHGFVVERHYKVETAFRAEYGDGNAGPNIAVLCEYDALPEIGHACGHNRIAEAGVAAGLGIKAALQTTEKPMGKVTVLGTPAEEGGGGKNDLINGGAFKDIDVAMMVHPAHVNISSPTILAKKGFTFELFGKAAHASAAPWDGVNALDAAVMAYQSVSCLRQEMKPDCRIHGVIKKGGLKANIIPDHTELEYSVRAPTSKTLEELVARVLNCMRGAALCTGCRFEYSTEQRSFYLNLITNQKLVSKYNENARRLGVVQDDAKKVKDMAGSTDMGNVSYVVPSIHPMFSITTTAKNHTKEFTVASGDPKAHGLTIKQGKALAHTALDVFTDPDLLIEIKKDFEKDLHSH